MSATPLFAGMCFAFSEPESEPHLALKVPLELYGAVCENVIGTRTTHVIQSSAADNAKCENPSKTNIAVVTPNDILKAIAIADQYNQSRDIRSLIDSQDPVYYHRDANFNCELIKKNSQIELTGLDLTYAAPNVLNFCKNLHLSDNVHSLLLSKVYISDLSMELIASVLRDKKNLTRLDITHVFPFSNKSLIDLSHAFKEHKALKHLNISNNLIRPSGALALANNILSSNPIQNLNISRCKPSSDSLIHILKALEDKGTIISLNLDYIPIDTAGTSAVSSLIRKSTTLRSLSLYDGIEFNPEFIAAVRVNQSLTYLDISHCRGSNFAPMDDVLKTNTNLQKLIIYNTSLTYNLVQVNAILSANRSLSTFCIGGINSRQAPLITSIYKNMMVTELSFDLPVRLEEMLHEPLHRNKIRKNAIYRTFIFAQIILLAHDRGLFDMIPQEIFELILAYIISDNEYAINLSASQIRVISELASIRPDPTKKIDPDYIHHVFLQVFDTL